MNIQQNVYRNIQDKKALPWSCIIYSHHRERIYMSEIFKAEFSGTDVRI